MTDWSQIAAHLSTATGTPVHIQRHHPISGGCINRAALIEDGARTWFVKLNSRDRFAMFEAEAAGLTALAAALAFRVPEPICLGVTADESSLRSRRLRLALNWSRSSSFVTKNAHRNTYRPNRTCTSRGGA